MCIFLKLSVHLNFLSEFDQSNQKNHQEVNVDTLNLDHKLKYSMEQNCIYQKSCLMCLYYY